ncbi:MAG: dihydropteroate synthase-like protein, partial [Methanosarcinales archaeon]
FMKILVVTGRLAENTVRSAVKDFAEVLVVDINIAAFITPSLLKRTLQYVYHPYYDLILIPGLISADFSKLEEEIGVKIRLGPKHAYDLSWVLKYVEETEFSKTIPACELLASKLQEEALSKIIEIESKSDYKFKIGDLKIGGGTMKVMAEIVDATKMDKVELIKKIKDFIEKGADIIDLGVSLDASISEVQRTVKIAKSVSSDATLPISIDTLNPDLIKAAIEEGVDLVLSLDSNNLKKIGEYIANKEVPAVIIPDSLHTPHTSNDSLFPNLEFAKSFGIEVIADPILDPIGHGFTDSVIRYYKFRQKDKETPLFFGVGNVTELMDADSIGVNAVLAGIASEINASILFTPEHSNKTIGSISELKTASQMMALAKERKSAPKDLGIDLLRLKEKRRFDFTTDAIAEAPENTTDATLIYAKLSEEWTRDPAGSFKIGITESKKIIAIHKKAVIIGNNAKEVMDTIIREKLVSRLDHAGYLGRELNKAEFAIKFGRSYMQE